MKLNISVALLAGCLSVAAARAADPPPTPVALLDCIGLTDHSAFVPPAGTAMITPDDLKKLAAGSNEWGYETVIILTSDDPSVLAKCDDPGPIDGLSVATVYVHDKDRLIKWAKDGFIPAFVEQEDVIAVPAVKDSVMDIAFSVPLDEGGHLIGTLRIRAEDGAAAVVDVSMPESGMAATRAGRWWPLCCFTQSMFCRINSCLFPWLGCQLECEKCVQDCFRGGRNPCHKCDPCGLTWILCHVVPGAHC